ncbi:MAG: alpha-L-fucosidase [Opitutaceae bacterium]
MMKVLIFILASALMAGSVHSAQTTERSGEAILELRTEDAERGELFNEGNYAMFVHWGLNSILANKVYGKTHYGIGEWIMDPKMAGIPVADYKQLGEFFNPVDFDAKAIVQLAKDAGMKYVVFTAKHHEGFAMYDSKADDFNIVDATPWKRDPMKELADACREAGLGLGFYYSHNQDWTFPGGAKGPVVDEDGAPATFEDYFAKKCVPQVEELTTRYGPIEIVWFDTPFGMTLEQIQRLEGIIRKNQPKALISGRIGHNKGDYQSLGDMEVPNRNVEGMWESVDTTNNSWAYAWYDENWKTPKEILHRLLSCVGRGGSYMLNIGLSGTGAIPERAASSLRDAGDWLHRYPQVLYGADASPWGHALPWGDVTVKDNRLFLSVFEWPESGKLFLPGLKTGVKSVRLLNGAESDSISHTTIKGWTVLELPRHAPEKLVSVIEVELTGEPVVDQTFGLDFNEGTEILAEFSTVQGVKILHDRWVEKFGEWHSEYPAAQWTAGAKATFDVDVLVPGDYDVALTYAGAGRLVWRVEVVGGERIQNQQDTSHNYEEYPIGWLNFPAPGKYQVAVSCLEGHIPSAKLKSIRLTPLNEYDEEAIQAFDTLAGSTTEQAKYSATSMTPLEMFREIPLSASEEAARARDAAMREFQLASRPQSALGTSSGNSGLGTSSGYSGLGTSSGYSGLGSSSGYSGLGTSSGYSGLGTSSGYSGLGTSSGYSGLGTSSGYSGLGSSSGISAPGAANGGAVAPAGNPMRNSDGSTFVPKDFYPKFSWDTTPLYFMFEDKERVLTPEEVRSIAERSDFICIEKAHAFNVFGATELATKHEVQAFKSIKPDIKVLFYCNSAYAWPYASYNKGLAKENIEKHPELKKFLLTNPKTGKLGHRRGIYFFDVLNPEFREWWVETTAKGIRDSESDGVFIDQMHGFVGERPTRSAEIEWVMGEMVGALKREMESDQILLANNANGADAKYVYPVSDAVMFENYAPIRVTKENLLIKWGDMLKNAQHGKISVFRMNVEGVTRFTLAKMTPKELEEEVPKLAREKSEFALACYLIGAQPYSYFMYGWGWTLHEGALMDYPEWHKPLGAPKGPFHRTWSNGWEFTREFEHAKVWVNTETREGKITWNSDQASGE